MNLTILSNELQCGKPHLNSAAKCLFAIVIFFVFLATFCDGQSSANSDVNFTNWGADIQGVELAIALTNDAVPVGSKLVIFAKISNSSTNIVGMAEEGEMRDFDVFLINSLGTTQRLTPDTSKWPHDFRARININPGESREWILPLTIGKDVEPGNYMLKASTTHVGFEIMSNLLKVEIK